MMFLVVEVNIVHLPSLFIFPFSLAKGLPIFIYLHIKNYNKKEWL